MQRYHGIERLIKSDHKGYFFSPGAMRFFNSRILWSTARYLKDDSAVFITSERYSADTPRMYTIRRMINGDIHNVSKFQEFHSADSAKREMDKVFPR